MGIGWGPASNMVRTVNKQRAGSVKRSLKESSESTLHGEKGENGLKFKESTPEQIDQIREKMQKENRRKLIMMLVAGGIILAAILIGGVFV